MAHVRNEIDFLFKSNQNTANVFNFGYSEQYSPLINFLLFMAVDSNCVYLFYLSMTISTLVLFRVLLCHKSLYGQSPVSSISHILYFHELKTRTYLFIKIYALVLPFQYNLYPCLCDLECFCTQQIYSFYVIFYFVRGRSYTCTCIFHQLLRLLHLSLRHCVKPDGCMHRQMHPGKLHVVCVSLMFDVSFVVLVMSVHQNWTLCNEFLSYSIIKITQKNNNVQVCVPTKVFRAAYHPFVQCVLTKHP